MNKSGWSLKKIDDCADIIGGGTPSTKKGEYWDGDIPWITPKDLSKNNSKYISSGERYISQQGLDNSSSRILPTNSLLFSSRAPIGYLAINKKPVATNQGFKSLILKKGFDVEFFYYLFKDRTNYIKSFASGSTFQEVSASIIRNLSFLIPELEEQKSISNILSKIDQKIQINQKLNENMEKTSMTLFKSWFLDFDPVKAKSEGRQTNLSKEISDLFSDSFVNSRLGKIPKGYEIDTIKRKYNISIGKTPSRKNSEWFSEDKQNIPWVSIRDMGDSGTYINNTSEYLTNDAITKHNIKIIPENTVILSFKLTVGRVSITNKQVSTNEAIAHFVPKDKLLNYPFTFCLLKSIRYESISGTSSIANAINSKIIKNMELIFPNKPLLSIFNNICEPFFKKIKLNILENENLITIRDLLLPNLISGNLKISNISKTNNNI